MGDLNDLFGAVDGFVDDAMEFGAVAGTAVVSNIAFTAGTNYLMNKFWPTAPTWAKTVGLPLLAVGVGVAGGGYAMARGYRSVGMGLGVGLVSAGLTMGIRNFFPALPLAGMDDELMLNGLGASQDEALLGLGAGGEDLYSRYLGGASTSIESVNGLNAVTVEEANSVNGLGNWQVENVNGFVSALA